MNKGKPIYSLETLYKIAYDLKRHGKKICLTHGAFDLFHYSHLDLLQKSSVICDFLIVGVDSDASVSSYKSYKRPMIEERARMSIVNELDCVDATFIKNIRLDSESHIALYRNLMVDYITIGQHYLVEKRIDEDTQKAGARLLKLSTEQRYSTSSVIKSIVGKYAPSAKIPLT